MRSIQTLRVFLIALVASCAYAQYELPQDNPTASQIPPATPAQTPPVEAALPQPTVSQPNMMPQPMPVTPQMPAQVPDPQPISAPTDVVTPEELAAAKSLIQEIYKLNGDSGIPQCDAAKLIVRLFIYSLLSLSPRILAFISTFSSSPYNFVVATILLFNACFLDRDVLPHVSHLH